MWGCCIAVGLFPGASGPFWQYDKPTGPFSTHMPPDTHGAHRPEHLAANKGALGGAFGGAWGGGGLLWWQLKKKYNCLLDQ
jgi:hypothetical protein